jgi:GR25 family glycosyltransferase involved in LPS biosynthesis
MAEARRKVSSIAQGRRTTTCIHVRRGDYLKKPFYYNVLPEEYYRLALEAVHSSHKFLVFSETPEEIKDWAVWKGHDVHFVDEPSPLVSLLMMSLCDNHIIANSTMSLCGYLLSERKGVFVYPTQWFGCEGPSYSLDDIIPLNDPGAKSITVPSSTKSFLINLKSRPDRLQAFFKNYPGMISDIEVVSGFHGKNAENEPDKRLFYAMTDVLTPGEKGCFLSHMRVMQKIVDGGYERAIVMEDDITFTDDYIRRLKTVMDELPPSADFAFIGGRFVKDFVMKEEFAIPYSPHVVITKFCGPNFQGWNPVCQNRTSQCYMISARGARLFLDCFHMRPEQNFAYDFWYFIVAQRCNMTMYNANPLLCHSALVGDSDIR